MEFMKQAASDLVILKQLVLELHDNGLAHYLSKSCKFTKKFKRITRKDAIIQ